MAQRFWIGNSGTWDAADTTHWSTTSGGSGGASVPTSSDDVFFDANSFSLGLQIVTVNAFNLACKSMDWTGALNSPALYFSGSSKDVSVYGSLTCIASLTILSDSVSNVLYFKGTTVGLTVNFAGITMPLAIRFQGNNGEWTFQGAVATASQVALTCGGPGTPTVIVNTSGYAITMADNGSFDIEDGATVNLGSSILTFNDDGATRLIQNGGTLNMQTATINLINSTTTQAGLSFAGGVTNPGTSTIILSGDNTGISGPVTLYDVQINGGGTNPCYMTGDIMFHQMTFLAGTVFQFPDGGTITTTNLIVTGTSGNHVVLESDFSPLTWTISAITTAIAYADVTDSIAAGGAIPFIDAGGIDGGNNTNWSFTPGGPSPTFNNTPGAYNPSAYGDTAHNQKPTASDVLQQKPQGGIIRTGKPTLT